MKKIIPLILLGTFLICCHYSLQAQILNKLKRKTNEVLDKAINKKVDQTIGTQDSEPSNNPGSNNPTNKKGAGLKNSTQPDVQQQMMDAEKSFKESHYSNARYSIQQALTGVEIQLGKLILKSLPPRVNDVTQDTTRNVVYSNQWGWNNLTIQTVYKDNADKQMTLTIGNNVYYAGLVNMFAYSAASTQASGSEQNVKQTQVKGNKALITFDDSKGYSLILPLGQTSCIVWECVNFDTEEQVMSAAQSFDIEGIRKMMGEK